MIILHVITTLSRGGAENHLADLAISQVSLGHKVYVAYLQGKGDLVDRLSSHKVCCYYLDGSSKSLSKLIFASFKLRKIVREVRPDIIHAHMPPAEIVSWFSLLSSSKSIKYVISKHVDSSFFHGSVRREESFVGKIVASIVMLRALRVIAISKSVSRYIIANYFLANPSKVALVYYGIDSDSFVRSLPHLRPNELSCSSSVVIGTAARLVPQKSIDVLLKAFARVLGSVDVDLRLVIAGDGPLRGQLQDLSRSLGIESSVDWLGQVSEIEPFMHSLDLFVLSSSYEGLGLVLLEAMASALPVVASNISAIPEIVENGQTGILCPEGDYEAFGDAINRLVSDPMAARLMGLRGLQRVNACFAVRAMLEQTMQVYSSR